MRPASFYYRIQKKNHTLIWLKRWCIQRWRTVGWERGQQKDGTRHVCVCVASSLLVIEQRHLDLDYANAPLEEEEEEEEGDIHPFLSLWDPTGDEILFLKCESHWFFMGNIFIFFLLLCKKKKRRAEEKVTRVSYLHFQQLLSSVSLRIPLNKISIRRQTTIERFTESQNNSRKF